MKIRKIHFIKHPIFNNHTIIFSNTTDFPVISYLIGNNGSGKTKVLESIYKCFTEPFDQFREEYEIELYLTLSEIEMKEYSASGPEIKYIIRKSATNNHHLVEDLTNNSKGIVDSIQSLDASILYSHLSKIIFSTIEVNFNEIGISSVTSKNIDELKVPKEISQNLSQEIPQLLIDIHALDNEEKGRWMDENKGETIEIPTNLGTRLERFTNAFHKIYEGNKVYKRIENKDGGKQILFSDSNGIEIDINKLSTGEKQIIYRIGYILKNLKNLNGGIILIDEPEISLHPTWQIKIKDLLLELFKDLNVQIIIATHSPYIFKNLNPTNEVCIKIDRNSNESTSISLVFPKIKYTPSINLINFLVYGIESELLHIELYTQLQIREKRTKITNSSGQNDGIENWLKDPNGGNIPIFKSFTKTGKQQETHETIMTWIRNKIHHSDEINRPDFNRHELVNSIELLISLLSGNKN